MRSAEALTKSTAALRTGTSVADAAEKEGNALEAVREYQRAAELEPSEANLFDWGAELLTHRAADQAVEVFTSGNRLFPRSTRTLLGLAVAWYMRGSYDQAAQRFFEAADLNPSDPAPYLFLGKLSNGPITESDGLADRLARFARLQPENAWANYYYAATLARTSPKARALLEKAVRLDPKLGDALFAARNFAARNCLRRRREFDQGDFSLPKRDRSHATDGRSAHYRLAQAYRKTGDTAKAQQELALYRQLSQQSAQKLEREARRNTAICVCFKTSMSGHWCRGRTSDSTNISSNLSLFNST